MFTKIIPDICIKNLCLFVGPYNKIRYNSCVLYHEVLDF